MRTPIRFCLWMLMLSFLVLPQAAFAQSDAEHQQFLFAYKLLQRGEVAEAASEFDEYLGKFPKGEKLGDVQYYRALLHRKAGDNAKAAAVLDGAAKPTLVPAYAVDLLGGQVLSDLGRYDDALKALERIKTDDLDPKVAVSALYLKGLAYRGAANLKAAATALSDAAKLDTPMKARALLDLAKVHALMKETDKALAVLNRCLAVEDKAITPEAARFAGDLSYNAAEFDQAIGYYSTVVSRHQTSKHFAPAVVGLLWAQFASEKYTDLQRTFDSSIQALPVQDRLPAYYLAGSSYQEQGKHDKAAALFDKATAGNGTLPIQEKALYKLARSRYELGEYPAMNAAVTRLLRAFPETNLGVDVAFLQATAEAESGQVERGAARLTQFVEKGPTDPYYQQALLRRAHLYETHKEIEPAANDYEAYLASVKTPTSTSLQASFRLMELLGALAKHDRVIKLASGMLEMSDAKLRTPEVEQEALYRLAVANRFKGELDKALALHARLTRDHPINPYRAESVLEQGLIRMTQGDTERGVPLLLDAIEREGLSKGSKISAMRIVAQYDADNANPERALKLRMQMQQLGEAKVFSDDENIWLGRVLITQGQANKAIAYLDAVTSEKLKGQAMLLKGRALRMTGKLDESLELLNEVRAVSERYSVDAWLEIALVYRDNNKLDQALNELVALQDPDRGHRIASQALYEGGLIHRKLIDQAKRLSDPAKVKLHTDAAREAFKKLWLLYPDREGENQAKKAYLALAELQLATGDAPGEVKTLAELMESHPESAYGVFARAKLGIRANRPEQADRDLRQTIELAKKAGDLELAKRADDLLRRER